MALRVVSVRRAFTLLIKRSSFATPAAEVIHYENGTYTSYPFFDWAELSAIKRRLDPSSHDWIQTVRFPLAVPRVIRVLTFSRVPRHEVKFSRRHVFARDRNTCQYCLQRLSTAELSLDHVMPRSRGGKTTWDNVVSACRRCNVRKGSRTPAEANMGLRRPAYKPQRNPAVSIKLADERYASWKHFLDAANWNVELS
jgi:5-methylcytosine-specific restriction endonuclease McrA